MSDAIYDMVMWMVVAGPLLLAVPVLHTRVPWPRHLAIMPAVMLTLLPGDASLDLPWLLFGAGFAVDGEVRWILAMSVAVWFTAATVANSSRRDPTPDHATTFFLLTMAGNLGAVLATDLVGFFSFSTLMGYGFYGLLIHGGDEALRRAGRLYVIFLIVADLALFDALLLAAATIEDLRYALVRQTMAGTGFAQVYFWMALAAFVLKMGAWPFHLWVSGVFKSARLSKTLLLVGVPVAMGLVGAVRWLPLGETAFHGPWVAIQMMGVAAFLYATLRFLAHARLKMLPAWGTVATTGLFLVVLGMGLAHPAVWLQYAFLTHPFIASLGILLAALTFAVGQLQDTRPYPDLALRRVEALILRAGRWMGVALQWVKDRLLGLQSRWRASWLKAIKQYQRILERQQPGVFVAGWRASITVFVLLGLTLAWLAA